MQSENFKKKLEELSRLNSNYTERIKSLGNEAELYKLFFEFGLTGNFVSRPDGTLIECNETFVNIFGFQSKTDALDTSMYALYPDDSIREKLISKINEKGEIKDYEEELIDRDGNRIFVLSKLKGEFDPEGKLIKLRGSLIDITRRKQQLDSLQEKRDLLVELLEYQGEGLGMVDENENFIYASPSAEKIFGVSRDGLIGKNVRDFTTPEQYNEILKRTEYRKQGEKRTYTAEIVRADRRKRTLLITAAPRSSESEEYRGAMAIFRDITDSQRTEKVKDALLKISESINTTEDIKNLYKRIHEIISELMPADNFYIALYDQERDMLNFPYYVDEYDDPPEPQKAGKGLTEYVLRTGKDLLVDSYMDMKLRQSGEVELLGEPTKIWMGIVLKSMEKVQGVMVLQDYEDETAYNESDMQVLVFVSEQIALAIDRKLAQQKEKVYADQLKENRDLLQQKAMELARMNKRLTSSEKELKELNAAKDKFFSIISHDLRSPFNSLLNISNLLVDEVEDLSKDEIINFVGHIHSTSENLYNLIENLLQWSRIQTERIECEPVKMNIYELSDRIMTLLKGNAYHKEIDLINAVDKTIRVMADPNMMQSVLQNLIANAIKFTKRGGEVKVISTEKGDFAGISIIDTGVGIAEDDLEKIFRIDAKHTTRGTEDEKGSGLGLVLCRELIEKQGGEVSIKSKLGVGTTVSFTLPLAD